MNRVAVPLSAAMLSLAAAPLVALAVPSPRAAHRTTVDTAAVVIADGGGDPCIAGGGSQPFKYPLCAAD